MSSPAPDPSLLVSDRPRDDASAFSFDRITATLRDFIQAAPPGEPFNVCVSGTWGSGKTSLLRSLAAALGLDGERTRRSKGDVGLWFEPWKLADGGEVRDALTLLVLDRIGADASFLTRVKVDVDGGSLVRVLGQRFSKVNLDDVSRSARAETAMRGTFVELERLFHDIATSYLRRRRMVVFVDDLDRCSPAVMVAVLEAVKLFFDLPGLVFVFALDRDLLESAIADQHKLKPGEARVYLEKIFQLSVPLPRKRPEDLVSFLRENLRAVRLEVADGQLAEAVVSRFGRNLRDLKLFVNRLSFQRRLVAERDSKQIGEEAVLKWLYLEATMPSSLAAALADRSLDLVLALELLAYGGFLHDGETRDRYVGLLRRNSLNYCALIVYALVAEREPEELDEVELTAGQRAIVVALNADGGLDATLRVLRAGGTRLLDVDLWRLAALTRDRPPEEPAPRPSDADDELALDVEGILTAFQWDALGERLRRDGILRDAHLCLVMATLAAPRAALYTWHLARLMRRLERPEGAKALLSRAHALRPRDPHVHAQAAYLYDRDLGNRELGSLLYRRALETGSKDSNVPNNLGVSYARAGRFQEAYLCSADAYVRKPDLTRRARLNMNAYAAGGLDPLADYDEERLVRELRRQLMAARRTGDYPPRLSDDERRRVEKLYETHADADAAAAELSRPPL